MLTIAGASIWSRSRCTTGRMRFLGGRERFGRDRVRGARQVEQVRALGVVELERPGQRFEHQLGAPLTWPRSRRR